MNKKMRKKIGAFETPMLRNASKTLFANIRFASVDERIKTMAFTSSTPDEGKSTVCSNLACAIASAGHRVLLVELDMRRRCQASMLNVHARHGIYAVLSGEAQLDEAIIPTGYDNLYFMDSEPNIPNPPDLLSTRRFASLVDELREAYDYVIFDTPPLGVFVDAAIVSNLVDGVIVVVREHWAKRDLLESVIKQLKTANARILGAVMTFTKEVENSYYYNYYNSDREKHNAKSTQEEASLPAKILDDNFSDRPKKTSVNSAAETRKRHTNQNNPRTNTSHASTTSAKANTPKASTSHVDNDANPYTPGAFKTTQSATKQPKHKSNRI